MRYPIRFDRPTDQEQAYNDSENCLFLFGQVVHARQYSGKPVVSQSQNANRRRARVIWPTTIAEQMTIRARRF
jgi:hypothetical protein